MGYSGILRRLFSHSGNLRSPRKKCFRFYCRNSDANRGGVSSLSVPWLMLPPEVDGSGNIGYKFQRLEKEKEKEKEVLHFSNRIGKLQLPIDIDISKDVEFVGSSQGWLALFNWHNTDLFLSNPITDQHLKLPPLHGLGAPDRVILDDEERNLVFMTYGRPAKLAFCSPRRSKEWSIIRRSRFYNNIVYSSRHKRLFCVCEKRYNERISLQCWDVHHHPTLDWEIQSSKKLSFGDNDFKWPEKTELKWDCFQMKYLVCAEHSGDLFLVVRHVNRRAGPFGSMVNNEEIGTTESRIRGLLYDFEIPYKTVDFDVYKVDLERREVMHMDRSLQGLAMFVGINQPIAIPAEGQVMPNSVYFADENYLVEPWRLEPATGYGGHDNGIFDYQNKDFYPCCDFYPIEYEKMSKILPPPLWFAPNPTTII